MKKLLFVLLVSLISCTETHFANKVMRDIGDGKFMTTSLVRGFSIIQNDDVFDLAEVYDKKARERRELDYENFFMTDIMFDGFKLIETRHEIVSLLEFNTIHKNESTELKDILIEVRENSRVNDKNYRDLSDSTYISTAYADINKYIMKYKISTKLSDRIGYLTVIRIPDEGFRITSFFVL